MPDRASAKRFVKPRHVDIDPELLKSETIKLLESRGVTLADIAEIVVAIQGGYFEDLGLKECVDTVEAVIEKREVQHAIMTGITLDILAEKGLVPEPLLSILRADDFLYGVDEVLALCITNVYGSIGLTNFGYLDKEKPGIIGVLNEKKGGEVHTFLDDLVASIAAAAAARIAHQKKR